MSQAKTTTWVLDQLFGPKDPYVKPAVKTPKFELTQWELHQLHAEKVAVMASAKAAVEAAEAAYKLTNRTFLSALAQLEELEERIFIYEEEHKVEARTTLQVFKPGSPPDDDGPEAA